MPPVQTFPSDQNTSFASNGFMIPRVLASFAILGGMFALVGWWGDFVSLHTVLSGLASMKANTALCCILLGVGLWARMDESPPAWRRPWRTGGAWLTGGLVVIVTGLTLLEYTWPRSLGIDELLVRDLLTKDSAPGRMSWATAGGLALLGLALLMLDLRVGRATFPAEYLALASAAGGGFALLGYLFNVAALYQFGPFSTMAVHTAILLVMIGVALLLARPHRGVMAEVMSDRMGGMVLRRALPIAAILVLAVAWLLIRIGARGAIAEELETALMVIVVLVILSGGLWWCARYLNRTHGQLEWHSRIHATLSECNQLFAHLTNRDAVVAEIARGLVQHEVFTRSEIWLREEAGAAPRLVASASGAAASVPLQAWTEGAAERGSIAWLERWAQTGEHPAHARCWTQALVVDGAVWGALAVQRATLTAMPRREGDLLREIASDLAFALDQLALRERHAVLAQERARLAAIVMSSDDAIVGKTLAGVVTTWNGGAEQIFGLSAAEMIGQPITRIIPAERLPEEAEIMERIRAGRRVEAFDTQRLHQDGRLVDLTIAVSPIRDAAGTIIGASKIARDNSRRAQAERRLQVSLRELERFKHGLDAHAIVAITDPQGRITYVNDKFCAISGYTRAELLGRDHRIINSGHHPKAFFHELWTTIGRGEVWHGEIRNRAKAGALYWMDTTIVPFLDDAGKPWQYMAIRADITPIKDAEAALIRQAEDLRQSNLDLEQFAYVASHDLQEPLRAVGGCLQVLERRMADKLDDRSRELIGHAVDGAGRMQTLIEGLLAFSRVGTRGRPPASVAPEEALQAALMNLKTALRDAGAEVTHDALPDVSADPVQLTQLFQNLIGNAVKFRGATPPRVHVGVAAGEDGARIITVQDNGIGIERQYFDRIFALFQRLHTRREYPGTGIGLALCKKIMERHGGSMRVESALGAGTTFYCTFPPVRGVPPPPSS